MMSAWLLLMTGVIASAEVVVIVNPDVEVTSLNQQTVEDIYRAHKGKWDDGQKIRVVMLKSGPVHEEFAKKFIRGTPEQLKSLWKKVIFSGAGMPPKIVHDETMMVSYVAANKGSIGYIDSSTPHDSVKVVPVQ